MGLFGKMFDLNCDRKKSTFEKAAEAAFVHNMFAEEEESESYTSYKEEADYESNHFLNTVNIVFGVLKKAEDLEA